MKVNFQKVNTQYVAKFKKTLESRIYIIHINSIHNRQVDQLYE